ncbi:MAG TPA: RNA polymerase subunit sigma-54 [Fervidobacterium sp.]|nr:RNA polymerase subunit sigma-54 [Fervidobacterium sp.]HQI10216.1 RNA polymerase subunit sigma-54 [Fervidobacterium sp.]HQI94292.1 RNA polymerase subunit sigma-54 [Fervidobacterium sp.]
MPDSKRTDKIKQSLEQKLILTRTEKFYLQVLEAPAYLLRERYSDVREINDEIYPSSEDLHASLEKLLPFLYLPDEDERIVEYIIYNIDSKGKLRISEEELCDKFGLHLDKAKSLIKLTFEEFHDEIDHYSANDDGSIYIFPDATIDVDRVEVRRIEVSDPFIAKALQMREETLYKICNFVREINEYFLRGYRKYPQIVTMTHVANVLDVNTATISRAVRNKFVNTPRGILPLRMFFGKGPNRALIINEITELLKVDSNLTDHQIMLLLKSVGINISRRTVNKYRNMINGENEELSKGDLQ